MKIVVALGGNALGSTPVEQLELVKATALSLVDLIAEGHQLIIAHGNGPQVGMINLAMESANASVGTPLMPFAECGAMSQGYIGYHLQNALRSELEKRNIKQEVVTLITQVEVSQDDLAWDNPSKPIGAFYTKEEAEELAKTNGYLYKEDAGRGYRRVIASPLPVDVVEKEVIKTLVEKNVTVITVGGGGIPVVRTSEALVGVAAVIDKDFAAAKLAEIVEADCLLILTAVEQVMLNYGQADVMAIEEMNITKAQEYIKEGQFAAGSMLPKVEAAVRFVSQTTDKVAIIAALAQAKEALANKSGTRIVKE